MVKHDSRCCNLQLLWHFNVAWKPLTSIELLTKRKKVGHMQQSRMRHIWTSSSKCTGRIPFQALLDNCIFDPRYLLSFKDLPDENRNQALHPQSRTPPATSTHPRNTSLRTTLRTPFSSGTVSILGQHSYLSLHKIVQYKLKDTHNVQNKIVV